MVRDKVNVVIVTKRGLIIEFPLRCLRITSRGCKGVRAVNLHEGDEVVSAFGVPTEE